MVLFEFEGVKDIIEIDISCLGIRLTAWLTLANAATSKVESTDWELTFELVSVYKTHPDCWLNVRP